MDEDSMCGLLATAWTPYIQERVTLYLEGEKFDIFVNKIRVEKRVVGEREKEKMVNTAKEIEREEMIPAGGNERALISAGKESRRKQQFPVLVIVVIIMVVMESTNTLMGSRDSFEIIKENQMGRRNGPKENNVDKLAIVAHKEEGDDSVSGLEILPGFEHPIAQEEIPIEEEPIKNKTCKEDRKGRTRSIEYPPQKMNRTKKRLMTPKPGLSLLNRNRAPNKIGKGENQRNGRIGKVLELDCHEEEEAKRTIRISQEENETIEEIILASRTRGRKKKQSTQGRKFTWRRGSQASKLDRILVDSSWLRAFPDSKLLPFKNSKSDHIPIRLTVDT
ncbi:hypothetical protein PIB30_080798 [Stylosanthes scabra]|uniref:Uncharacterized protein n=1 Tax=Stylosanthes scabra TaxID=79078 RepID=A0ABU6RRU8_9FABA|nr:hypothetical protein [Stylosanthes scabra]